MNEAAASREERFAEPPEVQERNLWLGVRVMAGVTIMFFLAFVFAYFYLRSLNNADDWRRPGIDPPQAYGAVIAGLFALSAAAFWFADWAARRRSRMWLPAAGAALPLGLAACIVQGFEWANLGFGPTKGGYASVFLGWTLLFTVFALVAIFWLEIVFATGVRHRRGERVYVPHGLDAASFYWTLLAVLAVIAWVILYLL